MKHKVEPEALPVGWTGCAQVKLSLKFACAACTDLIREFGSANLERIKHCDACQLPTHCWQIGEEFFHTPDFFWSAAQEPPGQAHTIQKAHCNLMMLDTGNIAISMC